MSVKGLRKAISDQQKVKQAAAKRAKKRTAKRLAAKKVDRAKGLKIGTTTQNAINKAIGKAKKSGAKTPLVRGRLNPRKK
jgi:hypothetical protein